MNGSPRARDAVLRHSCSVIASAGTCSLSRKSYAPSRLVAARTPTTPYPTVCALHPPPSPPGVARDARPQVPLRQTPHAPTPPPSAPSCAANQDLPLLIPVLSAGWKQWSGQREIRPILDALHLAFLASWRFSSLLSTGLTGLAAAEEAGAPCRL